MGKIGEIELSRSFTRALVKAGLCNGQMECVIIIKGGAQSFSEKHFLTEERGMEVVVR